MNITYCDIVNECKNYFSKTEKYYICEQIISNQINQQLSELKKQKLPKDKQKIVFYFNDSHESLDLPYDFTIMHYGIVKTKKKNNHFSMPCIIEPLIEKIDIISSLPDKPKIGFCGHYKSHPVRYMDLKYFLERQNLFDCDFILRKSFWGGRPYDKNIIKDFQQNMKNNIFNICTRGNGNFSIRLFETMSCGRIPVFTNVDMELPFEDIIDYSKFCIFGNRYELEDKIFSVWNIDQIKKMQIIAFETYKTYMTLENFPKTLHKLLEMKYK